MDGKIVSYLRSVGYEITDETFAEAVTGAPKSIEYANIVNFISNELRSICAIDEQINTITTPEDSTSFLMEVSSFLKELGCAHESLAQGNLSERLSSYDDKLLLLDYLISELMAARILQEGKPDKTIQLKVQETSDAHNLHVILETLQCRKQPENANFKDLFENLLLKTETVVTEHGKDLIGNPIWYYKLSDEQWNMLHDIEKQLHDEYTIRRKMMLQRLDCTIQSFQWSDQMKPKDDLIMRTYSEKRKQMKVEPDVDVAHLLAAREDLAIIEKTSNSSVRKNTKSAINRVVIGAVPDRGGRTSEQAPPPPEMPSWQARQSGSRGGGGRGRGGDGYHRGGRGGQQQQQNFDAAGTYTTAYHQGSGSYNSQNRYDDYQQQNDTKRARTFDSFQNQRQTYADQYVQESQYNEQYQPRNRGGGSRGRGGGRGNYNRGGRHQGQNYY